jgi:glycosyltransferase involved in cell wall biosynthesis
MPKYSILLPVHNGIKYIKTFMYTFNLLNFQDCELIVCENKCNDGTTEYLRTLIDTRIKVIHTERLLNQPDNWNKVIKQAMGEWVLLLGVDDGFPPYFFNIAETLTEIADQKKINIIKANRIYYFWEDSKWLYGEEKYSYNARPLVTICKTKDVFNEALYGDGSGFYDMPQMYATCFFRKKLIDKIISNPKSEGDVIHYVSPDGYLGTLACLLEKWYLRSEMPLCWVGSSSSSQGINDGNIKVTPIVTQEQMKNYDAVLYKTVNSTRTLIAGSLLKAQELKYENVWGLKYDDKKLLKKILNIDIALEPNRKEYFLTLANNHGYTERELKDGFLLKAFNQIYKILYKFRFSNIERKLSVMSKKAISISVTYDDLKPDTDISFEKVNTILNDNEILKNVVNMFTKRY